MAKPYRVGLLRSIAIGAAVRLGLSSGPTYILMTRGRKSGEMRSTPVTLVEREGRRWLVAPYGPVGWVHNARAAGRVTVSKGRRSEDVAVTEVPAAEAAPILREYLRKVPIVRPYFDVGADASDAEFLAEASRHPVFRIDP